MNEFKIGDIVGRKSYNSDIEFRIVGVVNESIRGPIYLLEGVLFRINADSYGEDLERLDTKKVRTNIQHELQRANRLAYPLTAGQMDRMPLLMKLRARPGKVLHIDSSREYLDMCMSHYRKAKVPVVGKISEENQQPGIVGKLLRQTRPDILIVTGHDALKKNATNIHSLDNYWNSRYYIKSVVEARKYEPNPDKLCIIAGACQSYYEAIMDAGANFASSPGRIMINALDPTIAAGKVAVTDQRKYVTPEEVASIIISGKKGIGGVRSRGQLR